MSIIAQHRHLFPHVHHSIGLQYLTTPFTLLRETREDIRIHRWTEPAVRATMKQDLRVKQAYEEIERCNVETRRLYTSIHDEHTFFTDLLCKLQHVQDPLYGAVEDYVVRHRRINAHLKARILQIQSLPGFTGDRSVGIRKGNVSPAVPVDIPAERLDDDIDINVADTAEELDDQTSGDLGMLVEYMTELSIRR
jgi:hypothetical protein